jgi:predicted metal-dependent phosphoesterase TrpH
MLPRIMARRGLHGVVLTEHDQLWPAAEIAALNRTLSAGRIYRGVEVSSRHGHFLVIGLNDLAGIRKGMAIEELLVRAHAAGAAVVWAHPLNNYGQTALPMVLDAMPPGIHAIETAGGRTAAAAGRQARAHAQRVGCTPVAGSDAHVLDQVGSAYTRFARLPKDEKSLAAAIMAGRCRPMELSD